jgi:hypothetical protein
MALFVTMLMIRLSFVYQEAVGGLTHIAWAEGVDQMRWNIRKRYRRLIRREGADIVIALVTGIITNMITPA